jgi:uncharacterized RDD family membrane protein YckC
MTTPPDQPPPEAPASAPGVASASRFCTNCGAPLAEGAHFCANCGAPVNGVAPAAPPAAAGPAVELAGARYELASFWRRAGAALIDGLVLSLLGIPFQVMWQGVLFGSMPQGAASDLVWWNWIASWFDTFALMWTAYVVAAAAVNLAFEAYGWTPGKALLGMRVLRSDGHRPGVIHGAARYTGKFFSSMFLGLGYLWAAWDPRRQGWHDKFASSFVVRVPEGGPLRPPEPGALAISTAATLWAGLTAIWVLGSVLAALALVAVTPDDGASWQRWFEQFERFEEPGPGLPKGPRT